MPNSANFLDIHAAFRGEYDHRTLGLGIVEDGGIKLTNDVALSLDQDLLHRVPANFHTENVLSVGARFRGRGGQLNTPRLSTLARGHLGFHNAGADFTGCQTHVE